MMSQKGTCTSMSDEPLGNQVVCQKHVFFNEFIRISNWIRFTHEGSFAIILKLESEFDSIERNRTTLKPQPTTSLGYFIHESHVCGHLINSMASCWSSTRWPQTFINFILPESHLLFNNVLRRRVVQPSARFDDGSPVPHFMILDNRSIFVHPPDTRKSEAFNVFVQTTCNFTERPWQHGDCSIHQVNCRAPPLCLNINCRLWCNKIRHVRDVHTNFYDAPSKVCDMKRIV
mmetsp:Transcript_33240/g.55641  ORF Transcript_33240/g.55641 Transcript_33240/m.55641 type:complete len:231 (+) Transcript_33240:2104-2796(+)